MDKQKVARRKRLAKGIVEKSLAEKRLDEIGILWEVRDVRTKRTIEVDEYMAEIVKYKEAEEQQHPGKPWDGHVPKRYSVTLEDGTEAHVGAWVYSRKTARRKRLEKGIEEKSLAEKRLDEIGIVWEAITKYKRWIEVDEYIAEIVKYKEACLLYTSPSPRDRG